jgi:hypothetical protein
MHGTSGKSNKQIILPGGKYYKRHATWLSYDPHIDRERSRLILCPANKQLLLLGPEHPLKLVDGGGGGERTQLPSRGREDTAATAAFGSMEPSSRNGELLLAASSLVAAPNRKHLFSHLISLEDSCGLITTGPICGIKHRVRRRARPFNFKLLGKYKQR